MVVSSRTPEGCPNYCPVCRKAICVEPSEPFGDATCPNCGTLLWFVAASSSVLYFQGEDAIAVRERIIEIVAKVLGVDADTLLRTHSRSWKLGGDSLDMVELGMELEEEFG
jgi:acyl carrier protein